MGGLGGARSYIRFDIPPIVLDSVQVIRASLHLPQRPSRYLGGNQDTFTLLRPGHRRRPVHRIFTASQ